MIDNYSTGKLGDTLVNLYVSHVAEGHEDALATALDYLVALLRKEEITVEDCQTAIYEMALRLVELEVWDEADY